MGYVRDVKICQFKRDFVIIQLMVGNILIRIWLLLLNCFWGIIGIGLVEDTKNSINRVFAADQLLFCYPGEIQMAKLLGMSLLMGSAVGALAAIFIDLFILKIISMIYFFYGISVFVLFKNTWDYWREDSSEFFLTTAFISICMIIV